MNKYKQRFKIYGFFVVLFCFLISCKTPEGCDAAEQYKQEADMSDGSKAKKGTSNLFSKKQRKKMKKRGQ